MFNNHVINVPYLTPLLFYLLQQQMMDQSRIVSGPVLSKADKEKLKRAQRAAASTQNKTSSGIDESNFEVCFRQTAVKSFYGQIWCLHLSSQYEALTLITIQLCVIECSTITRLACCACWCVDVNI